MTRKKSALTLALRSAVVASLGTAPGPQAAGHPFQMESLKHGYQIAAADKADKKKDGKCGEAKCASSAKKNKQKDKQARPEVDK